MDKFTHIEAVAAPLGQANVDTDKIIPARFLKTISRHGLGKALFHTMRFDGDDHERPDFVLNQVPWRQAGILIALDNFGCGSSREHAPWSLVDFGIRVIIAPSFADIFYNNCFKNGILPIALDRSAVDALMADAGNPASARMAVDLADQSIRRSNGDVIRFEIAPERKQALLLGQDEIAQTELLSREIAEFEAGQAYPCPSIPADIIERWNAH